TGRRIQTLGPVHEIVIGVTATTVRRAHWTVYRDDLRQVWTGSGYQKVGDSSFTLINPVTIRQMDQSGRTVGMIQAERSSTSGKLQASDSFPQSSWSRWSTTHYNDKGQV